MKSSAKKIQMPKVIYENQPLGLKEWGITLGLFVVIFILIIGFIPIETILSKSKYHFTGSRPKDEVAQIYFLIENQKIKPFDTILFGTSSSRASIENSDILEAQYREMYGKEMSFVNFSSTAQTFLQVFLFSERIDFRPDQTVIFNLTPSSFARTLGFTTGVFDEFHPIQHMYSLHDRLETVPELTGYIDEQRSRKNHLLTLRSQLYNDINLGLRHWAQKNIYGSYTEISRFYYDSLPIGDEEIIRINQEEKISILEDGFEKSHDFNMRLFRLTLEKILSSGAKVLFIEQARMMGDTTFVPWQDDYDRIIGNLTQDYPITYVNFNDQIGLELNDFHDMTHVWRPGRKKWSDYFLKWLDRVTDERVTDDLR